MPKTAELDVQAQELVAELVKSGRYSSADEAVKEGLRLLTAQEGKRADLHAAIDRGIADADAGRVKPAEEVFGRLIAKYEAMAKQAAE